MESIKDRVAIVGMGCVKFGENWATACYTLRGKHAGLLDTALGVVEFAQADVDRLECRLHFLQLLEQGKNIIAELLVQFELGDLFGGVADDLFLGPDLILKDGKGDRIPKSEGTIEYDPGNVKTSASRL